MAYTDIGFNENLVKDELAELPTQLNPQAFQQFTQDISSTKVKGGQIASKDGKVVIDLEENSLRITDAVLRVEGGKLSDGSEGFLVKDHLGNTLIRVTDTTNIIRSGNSLFNVDLNTGIQTMNGVPINFQSLQNGTTFLSFKNGVGAEQIKVEINSGGFGFITANQYLFTTNPGNSLKESFGVVAQLADSAGSHAFRVYDRDNNEVWRFASDGSAVQKKAKYLILQGTITAPGGQGSNTAALYVDTNAGKNRLMCEFNTGAAQVVATEP